MVVQNATGKFFTSWLAIFYQRILQPLPVVACHFGSPTFCGSRRNAFGTGVAYTPYTDGGSAGGIGGFGSLGRLGKWRRIECLRWLSRL